MKGGYNMKSKKAQSEVITTVLIILLVLAAIIIVWQVVMGVLNSGKASVESQSGCIGFSATVAMKNTTAINLVPNKAITAYRVYVNNGKVAEVTGATDAMSSATYASETAFVQNATVKVAGKIGDSWCDGMNEIKVP